MTAATLEDIRKVDSRLRHKDDVKADLALVLGPNVNWETFLIPAPHTICLLGQLMLVSLKKDFSLENSRPNEGFKKLNHPKSFRACLCQVSSEGYHAFQSAHKNMDKIRLLTLSVPDTMKSAVKILLKGTKQDIKEFLPIELNAVKDIAESCKASAIEVEDQYASLIALVDELLECSVARESINAAEMHDSEIKQKVLKITDQTLKDEHKNEEEELERLQKVMNDCQKKYDEALNDLPVGWKALQMRMAETAVNSISTTVDSMMTFATLKFGKGYQVASNVISGVAGVLTQGMSSEQPEKGENLNYHEGVENHLPGNQTTLEIYQFAKELNDVIMTLKGYYFTNDQLNMDSVKTCGYAKEMTHYFKVKIDSIQQLQPNSKLKDRVMDLYEEGKRICTELTSMQKDMNDNKSQIESIVASMHKLDGNVKAVEIEGNVVMGANVTPPMPPCQAAWKPDVQNEETTALNMVTQNAQFKISSVQKQLESNQDKYEELSKRRKKTNEARGKILEDMEKINIQNIDFLEIKAILLKGIGTLGELKEKWSILVKFFAMMSNLIKVSMTGPMLKFQQYAEIEAERTLAGYSATDMSKDLIYVNAFNSVKIAYLVNMISEGYVRVSNDHLLEQSAGLARLLRYDPETNSHDIQTEYQDLVSKGKLAQSEIGKLLEKQKQEFDRNIQKRMDTIKEEMNAILPPITSIEAKVIEEAEHQAADEIKKQIALQVNMIDTSELDDGDY